MNPIRVEHYTDDPDWRLRPIVLVLEPFQFKPAGALYTSPLDSTYSWRLWCEDNEFGIGRYRILLDIDAAGVLHIDTAADSEKLAWRTLPNAPTLRHIDFSAMRDAGVTAIWLTAQGESETRYGDPLRSLYGWDCETIAILDDRIILDWRRCDA